MKKFRILCVLLTAATVLCLCAGCADSGEKKAAQPKAVAYYEGSTGGLISRTEYEYDAAGNKKSERTLKPNENGTLILSYMTGMEYDDSGNITLYQSYETDAEEPYVDYEARNIYENGVEIKSEYAHLVDGKMVLFAYDEYENDDKNRIVRSLSYELNEETGEFEKDTESVYTYQGDFEQPVRIDTQGFGEYAAWISGTTTCELDDQGRETVSEMRAENFGMKTETEYDENRVSREFVYVLDDNGGWEPRYTANYRYNAQGNLLEELDEYAKGSAYRTVYEYDKDGETLLRVLYTERPEGSDAFGVYSYDVYEY